MHAYLHRVEGDLDNAAYWYQRAGTVIANQALSSEWQALEQRLLSQASDGLALRYCGGAAELVGERRALRVPRRSSATGCSIPSLRVCARIRNVVEDAGAVLGHSRVQRAIPERRHCRYIEAIEKLRQLDVVRRVAANSIRDDADRHRAQTVRTMRE